MSGWWTVVKHKTRWDIYPLITALPAYNYKSPFFCSLQCASSITQTPNKGLKHNIFKVTGTVVSEVLNNSRQVD